MSTGHWHRFEFCLLLTLAGPVLLFSKSKNESLSNSTQVLTQNGSNKSGKIFVNKTVANIPLKYTFAKLVHRIVHNFDHINFQQNLPTWVAMLNQNIT